MPTISIKKKYFYELLGKTLSDKEFEDYCFDFGLELEEDKDSEENIKVELPANRYDLFCVEGLAIAFKNYLELQGIQEFRALAPNHSLTVEESVKNVRPVGIAGIIRDVKFTQESYDSFIDFQDKLHHNLGRKRTLVSIGTHDYDKTSPPYFYRAKKKDEFSFKPLNQDKEMNGNEMLEFYKNDLNLKPYVSIIENSDVVPLIMDSKDNILSMPPIINSDLSKIDLNTKNIFIDITATDKTKALFALNVICACFSIYSETPCVFEQVEVIDSDSKLNCPIAPLYKSMSVQKEYLLKNIGQNLTDDQIVKSFTKMGLKSTSDNAGTFEVQIPFYRTDIMHQCDLAEDLVIGYGINEIPFLQPQVVCTAQQNKLNEYTELLRQEIAFCGFCESLNFSLCSKQDLTSLINIKEDKNAVEIENPKTLEFQVGRTTLLPGLLKNIAHNKKNKVPFKLFEIGDTILLEEKDEKHFEYIGACNNRKIGVIYCNSTTSGLDIVHGVLDTIFLKLFKGKKNYELKQNDSPKFLYSLQSKVCIDNKEVGEMGIIHPEVLKNYGINYATSFLELDFEALLKN